MIRRLGGGRRSASQDFLRRMLANIPPQPGPGATGLALVELALAAGKEALQRAGVGWYPESDVAASLHPGQPILLELIGFKRIELRVNPDLLAQRAAALQAAVAADSPLTIVHNAVRSLVRLFAGYYDACPRDLWGHRRLVEAASWGSFRTCHPTEKESRIAASIASFFERAMVTYALTRREGAEFVSGLALERVLNQHPPHLLSSLLQRSQAILFPSLWDNAFRISPLTPDPTADALLEEALFILFRARAWTARGHLRLRGRIRCPVSWEWASRVEELAELLVPYLEDSIPQQNPFQPPGQPGARPRLVGLPGGFLGADPGDLANPFAASDSPGRAPLPPGGAGCLPGIAPGPGTSCSLEQIDQYYSRQAQSLQVKDPASDRPAQEPEMLPVGFLDCAPASLRALACGQIDWFRTRRSQPTDENPAGLVLKRLTDPLEIPADASDPASAGVPNLLLVVDSSGSMEFNPQATGAARGKYDLVLLACWGLFRFLKERGLEDQVWINAINFSGTTNTCGWRRGSDLEPVKRILAAYEGGGTTLAASAFRSACASAPGRFLTLIMTDGSLTNTAEALEELHRTLRAENSLALLHIGAANAFTEGVRCLGGTVHVLNHAQELVGLCLDLAKAHYGAAERR